LALLDPKFKGLSIVDTVNELQRRYHPNSTLDKVSKHYFPRSGPAAITGMEGKPHHDLLRKLAELSTFKKRSSERMKKLHQDPAFAANRDATSSKTMKRLLKDKGFRQRQSDGYQKYLDSKTRFRK